MADETTQNDWRNSLPEDLRADPSIKDFKDVVSLVKSYRDTKSLVGASIRIPGPDAGPEAKAEFRKKLQEKVPELIEFPEDAKARAEVEATIWERMGKPKDVKDYKAEAPKDFNLEPLRAYAAKLGLTNSQFASLVNESIAQTSAASEATKAQEAALRKEWGLAYDERVSAARAVAKKLGIPEEAVKAMPFNQMPVWFNVAKALGAERSEVGSQGDNPGKLSPSEARAQLVEIEARKELWDNSNPQLQAQLNKKRVELMEMLYPEE